MSCLFNSLSYFVDDDSHTIRAKVCDFIEGDGALYDDVKSSDIIRWGENSDIPKYVRSMRSTSTWGSGIEIKAFCEVYNKIVDVYSIRSCDDRTKYVRFMPSSPMDNTPVRLEWSGSHYEPIRCENKVSNESKSNIQNTRQVKYRMI